MEFKIYEQVFVDNILCRIWDIVEEDSITYYEVYPIDFNSISRYVTSEFVTREQINKKGV